MFGLVPFNFKGVNKRNDEFRNFIDEFFELDNSILETNYNIKADISDLGDKYLIEAEMPGVNKEDISLNLKDEYLTIAFKIEKNEEKKNSNYIRKERKYGCYSRRFYVENIDNDRVEAKYENGILTITLPKLANEQKKEYDIKIN